MVTPLPTTAGSQAVVCSLGLALLLAGSICLGQDLEGQPPTLISDAVRVDEIDSGVRADLAQAADLAAAGQFSAALERYRVARQAAANKLVAVDEGRRFVPLSDAIALRLVAWPTEGLLQARRQFDPLAQPLFAKAIAARDENLLARIVDDYFVSSVADEALLALGDMALEQGRPQLARSYWLRISPRLDHKAATSGLATYPDTDLDLAAVAARIALASIWAGDRTRARREIDRFAESYPTAMGTLGGRQGAYRSLLEDLWKASADWPEATPVARWPTFAGDGARNATVPQPLEIGRLAWPPIALAIEEPATRGAAAPLVPGRKQGEFAATPCSTFPIWIELAGRQLLLYCDERAVYAIDATTGQAAWTPGEPPAPIHTIPWKPVAGRRRVFGVPRHTLTAAGGLLLARLGTVGTAVRGGQVGVSPSYLACLDLNAEGRLLWRTPPADRQEAFQREGWSFDGPPVCDGERAYVALRRTDIRAQAFVACYDLASGRPVWQTFVCAADMPGQGNYEEAVCSLLSLAEGRLYFNTNQGVVASLSTSDGSILWAARYPRALAAEGSRPAASVARPPNPCLVDRGRVYAAPSDTPAVLAFDAASGQQLWRSEENLDDLHYLLGAHDGWLVCSGDRLHWLSTENGQPERSFPAAPAKLGCGRGLIASGKVYWPTRGDTDSIRVFDLASGRPENVVDLSTIRGGAAGNLLAVGSRTVVAAHDALYCFSPQGDAPAEAGANRTARDASSLNKPVAR
jgi:outer membrane protein assembly factor BamB